jgi:hypothetical protein
MKGKPRRPKGVVMVPADDGCGAIPGVRYVAWATVPLARAVITGVVASVSGADTMVSEAGVALARAEILHFVRELFNAIQNLSVVCC